MVSLIGSGGDVSGDVSVNSVTAKRGTTVTEGSNLAQDSLHYGSKQNRASAGREGAAFGIQASVTAKRCSSFGHRAGANNSGSRSVCVGTNSGANNSSQKATLLGTNSGRSNVGSKAVGIGASALRNNVGDRSLGLGSDAGRNNTASDCIFIGDAAGKDNSGAGVIGIGPSAAGANGRDDILIITDRNGNNRLELDLISGDLKIAGSLTQNATL
jgi:hypothetical protein